MDEIALVVGGMSCRRCVREVTALLRDVPGVLRVTVDPARSTVRVTGSMTPADVQAAFVDTDYWPVLSDE